MVQNRTSIVILVLACLIFIGYSANGYSQEQSNTPQTPGTIRAPRVTGPFTKSPRRQLNIEVLTDLSVSPTEYTGPCSDAVFTFKGHIYANRAIAVKYRFLRSDGVRSEAKTLVFEKEGSQEVTYTWPLGDNLEPPAFSGDVVMEVFSPNYERIQSNHVPFTGTCTGQGMPELKNPPGQPTGQ